MIEQCKLPTVTINGSTRYLLRLDMIEQINDAIVHASIPLSKKERKETIKGIMEDTGEDKQFAKECLDDPLDWLFSPTITTPDKHIAMSHYTRMR